jgi:hypothetical protein
MKQECVRDYETLIQPQQLHGLEMTQKQAIHLAKQLIDEIKTGMICNLRVSHFDQISC